MAGPVPPTCRRLDQMRSGPASLRRSSADFPLDPLQVVQVHRSPPKNFQRTLVESARIRSGSSALTALALVYVNNYTVQCIVQLQVIDCCCIVHVLILKVFNQSCMC